MSVPALASRDARPLTETVRLLSMRELIRFGCATAAAATPISIQQVSKRLRISFIIVQ